MKRGPEIRTTTRLKIQMNLHTKMDDLDLAGQSESCSTSTDHIALLLQCANTDEYAHVLPFLFYFRENPFNVSKV